MTDGGAAPRLAVIEDHGMVRELLVARIQTREPAAVIAYAGASATDAVSALREQPPDAIVLDLDLGDGSDARDNITLLRELDAPVLVVSAFATSRLIQEAIGLGVSGYVSKQCPVSEFDAALRAVLSREEYVSRDLARRLAVPTIPEVELSAQERRALTLYASGMKLEAVGRQMGVSFNTASEYIRRVRAKYERAGESLPSKVDLYRKAREEWLL